MFGYFELDVKVSLDSQTPLPQRQSIENPHPMRFIVINNSLVDKETGEIIL